MFKNLFSDTPSWVRDLPETDSNKTLLLRVIKVSGEPLDTPKRVIFAIKKLSTRRDAMATLEYLQNEGWICKIGRDPDMYLIEACNNNYVFSKNQLTHDELF